MISKKTTRRELLASFVPKPVPKVQIIEDQCIAYAGPECGACEGLCPDGLRGIVLQGWKPVVELSECVGCGLCIEACPASPKAITPLATKV